jgi:endoribonuclease Dicer
MHSLGDKTIADVCEALIGAAFITHNVPGTFNPDHWRDAIKAVTKLVSSPDHAMMEWKDYIDAYQEPTYQTQDATAAQRDLVEKAFEEHPYRFRYPRLLRSAFVHPSYPFIWEKVPSYQRLEFLGDALLDMASITYLFYLFPDKDPQWLTEHKMAMVSNKFLGALCVKIGFYRHLRYNNSAMEYQIREYVTEIQEAERESRGARDYWTSIKAPPKVSPVFAALFSPLGLKRVLVPA